MCAFCFVLFEVLLILLHIYTVAKKNHVFQVTVSVYQISEMDFTKMFRQLQSN